MKIFILLVCLLVTFEAKASCDYSKKPKVSIKKEFNRSNLVMIATITNQRIEEYSKNYSVTYFSVEVNKILKSRYQNVEFKSEIFIAGNSQDKNFELENGKKYLLFVGYNPDGYLISECGNSAKLDVSVSTLKEVEFLSKK